MQDAVSIFENVEKIGIVRLTQDDIQRSKIAKIVIEAYNNKKTMNTISVHNLQTDKESQDDDESFLYQLPLSISNIVSLDTKTATINNRTLKKLIYAVAKYTLEYKKQNNTEIHIVLVSADKMRQYNREFRNKDYTTDILSFSYETNKKDDFVFTNNQKLQSANDYRRENTQCGGDIIMCLEKVQEQAKEYGEMLSREIARITIHGVLHILGHTHKSYSKNEAMLLCQENILVSFFEKNKEAVFQVTNKTQADVV